MSDTSPRLWFLRLLETYGSIRSGFATALVLWSLGAVAVFAAGDASPIGLYFAVIFPLYIGYNLAFAPVVLAWLAHAVNELEGIDRLSIPLPIAASAVGVAIHAWMVTLTPAASGGAFPPLLIGLVPGVDRFSFEATHVARR